MTSMHTNNILKVNLKSIAKNYQLILSYLKNDTECAAVVKSNAYGLGVLEVSMKLSSVGCSKFFVSSLEEAISLRSLSLTDEIYVLYGFKKGEEDYFLVHNLIPVLNDVEQVVLWRSYAQRKGRMLPAIINVDTGMNRMGLSIEQAKVLFDDKIDNYLKILYVMSHLSCADEISNNINDQQYQDVLKIKEYIGDIPISFANSAGVFLGKKYHFDLARVGAAIYGLQISANMPKMENVVSLTSEILQIREITKDGNSGYGATAEVKKGQKLAVIPIGYAHGLMRSGSNKGYCFISEVKAPIIGRISMDTFVADVSNVPEKELYVGAEVEIISDQITVCDNANFSSTIGYETLVSLGNRFKKQYIGQ